MHALDPIPPGRVAKCSRCGTKLLRTTRGSLHITGALALGALLLYVPANVFPILRLELYGSVSENTVWDGVRQFYNDHEYVLSIVVLLASIVIPLIKLTGLFFIVIATQLRMKRWKKFRTWVYRIIDSVGRWAMLDVFVLSIWVAVVKLGSFGSVYPGIGLLPFGGVVILTLLASASFDPQLIWESEAPVL